MLSEEIGLAPAFFADYRRQNGFDYPSVSLKKTVQFVKMYENNICSPIFAVYKTSKEVATEMATEALQNAMNEMEALYVSTVEYFNSIFCGQ